MITTIIVMFVVLMYGIWGMGNYNENYSPNRSRKTRSNRYQENIVFIMGVIGLIKLRSIVYPTKFGQGMRSMITTLVFVFLLIGKYTYINTIA